MEQPNYTQDASMKRAVNSHEKHIANKLRATERLDFLRFDPLIELVQIYKTISGELLYQEKMRTGEIVELNLSGKKRAYRAEVHHALFDKLINISDKLLRYKYGRVPESTEITHKDAAPLVINLTKKGDQYVVNDGD